MARNGSGAYSLPAGNPVVTGTTISSTVQNNTMTDIGTALTQSLAYDGQTNPVANLPMAGFKHTGVANAAARTDYAAAGQVQDSSLKWAGTAGGAANALTLTLSPAITAIAAGQRFAFKSGASPNSAATTVAISGLTAIAVQVNGAACAGGEILANSWYEILVNTTTTCQLNKIGRATLAELGAVAKAGDSLTGALNEARATVAGNATTSDIWGAAGNTIDLTGVITYTNFPAAPQAGAKRRLYPATGAVFTNAGAFSVVGNANYTVPAGASVDVEAITTTTFRLVPLNADGTPIVAVVDASTSVKGKVQLATSAEAVTGTDALKAITPATMKGGLNASGSAPMFVARAIVNFNGVTNVINASGNVASITKNATGDYTINLTTALPDAFGIISALGSVSVSGAPTTQLAASGYMVNASSARVIFYNSNSATPTDMTMAMVTILR